MFCTVVLLGMVMAFATFNPLRLAVPAVIFANAAPEIIPSLREWQGSTGSFAMSSASRIVVDSTYTAQLNETAKVFQGDLYDITGYKLSVVNTSSPGLGDFFLT